MKKIFALWLMLSMLLALPLGLVACTENPEDYYSDEEIHRKVTLTWTNFASTCQAMGLYIDPFASEYYRGLVEQDQADNVSSFFIRCLQKVSFDAEIMEEGKEYPEVYHGAYAYDIYTFYDGTGVLFFHHFCYGYDQSVTYTPWQTEQINLSADEVTRLKNLLEEWDFQNIPTWNPEERSGHDGETTYVYSDGLGHNNLISMWESTERYGIYHIREAIEEIVRSHVTVERGRIYNESRFND